MASAKATNPPRWLCTQCWFHAYASREAHAGLGPREDCPQCVDHMKNGRPPRPHDRPLTALREAAVLLTPHAGQRPIQAARHL